MGQFEDMIKTPPTGYKVYNNGSHQTTAVYKAQRAIDLAILEEIIANEDFTITALYNAGTQSYVKGIFKEFGEVWFVHAYKPYLRIGQVIKAGLPIVKSTYNHYHIFSSKFDFYQKYMGQKTIALPPYKGGDHLMLLTNMKARKAPGTDTEELEVLQKDSTIELISERFPIDDNYSWLETNKGWVAYQADWYRVTSKPIDPCTEVKRELELAKDNNATLSKTNVSLSKEVQQLKEVNEAFKTTVASYMESELRSASEIQELNRKLKLTQDSAHDLLVLNAKMTKENIEAQKIVENKDNLGWALSNLISVIKKSLKRFE
jgi:hypothetical protein